MLATLRFFHDAPQGPHQRGVAGYKGFFYHFLDMKTGERFDDSELSTVDTAMPHRRRAVLPVVLRRRGSGGSGNPSLADDIYRRVDWHWAQPQPPAISLGWSPEDGFLEYDWRGYNEAMLVYSSRSASPTHPVGTDAWDAMDEHL